MLKFDFQKTINDYDNDKNEYSLRIYTEYNQLLSESIAKFTLDEITSMSINLAKFNDISTSINFTPETKGN